MKKLLTAAFAALAIATPAQAYPVWADVRARHTCEFLALGLGDFMQASDYASQQTAHWNDEIFAVDTKVSSAMIVAAIQSRCPRLLKPAWDAYKARKQREQAEARKAQPPVVKPANPLSSGRISGLGW